jgi:hypothetical protein
MRMFFKIEFSLLGMLICVDARIFCWRGSSFCDIQRIEGAKSSHSDGLFGLSEDSGMLSAGLAISIGSVGNVWKDCFIYLQSHAAKCSGCRSSDSNRSISKLMGNVKTFVQVSEFDGRDRKISFLSDQIKFTYRWFVSFLVGRLIVLVGIATRPDNIQDSLTPSLAGT